MKLWSFLFTKAEFPLESARVAAADRVDACAQMEAVLREIGRPMILVALSRYPADGVLLSYMGEVDLTAPGIVSAILPNGATVDDKVTA